MISIYLLVLIDTPPSHAPPPLPPKKVGRDFYDDFEVNKIKYKIKV